MIIRLYYLLKLLIQLVILIGIVAVMAIVAFRIWSYFREYKTYREGAPASGRYVEAHDVEIFVQEMGSSTAPAVLFIHGTGAWSETWRPAVAEVSQAGFRAIAIDVPPFGYSERPQDHSYDRMTQAKRITALIDALQLNQVILVGHSYGGGATVETALMAPQRVRALVLVDVALGLQSTGKTPPLVNIVLGITPLRNALIATTVTNPFFTKMMLGYFLHDSARATDQWVNIYKRPLHLKGSTHAVGEWLPTLLTSDINSKSSQPAEYARLTMPTVIFWGREDTITPLSQGEYIKTLIPHSEMEIFENINHIPQIETTELFNRKLVDALLRIK